MGTIETHSNKELNLTIHTVSGEVTAKELILEVETYYHLGEATRLILWDFSEASLTAITSKDVTWIAKHTSQYAGERIGGKTALVFSSDLGFGLGRMYDIRQDIEKSQLAHMCFRSRQEAMEWLTKGEEKL